jgi:hypothetical protein
MNQLYQLWSRQIIVLILVDGSLEVSKERRLAQAAASAEKKVSPLGNPH